MKRILVCEDEDTIRDFIIINLERSGYEVVGANSGERALEVFDEERGDFDVAVLDIMMPGIDGITVCKELRKRTGRLGIIMLSAKSQEMDKVSSLMQGADDYVTKPFSPSELLARVDAVYRRVSMVSGDQDLREVVSGPFVLSMKSRALKKNGVPISLTQVEYQLMEYFLRNRNIALERTKILMEIWGESYYGDVKIVDVNIRRLRQKIEEDPSNPKYIKTVWGFGYKWEEA